MNRTCAKRCYAGSNQTHPGCPSVRVIDVVALQLLGMLTGLDVIQTYAGQEPQELQPLKFNEDHPSSWAR